MSSSSRSCFVSGTKSKCRSKLFAVRKICMERYELYFIPRMSRQFVKPPHTASHGISGTVSHMRSKHASHPKPPRATAARPPPLLHLWGYGPRVVLCPGLPHPAGSAGGATVPGPRDGGGGVRPGPDGFGFAMATLSMLMIQTAGHTNGAFKSRNAEFNV